jgi:hypothetical protein
MAVIGFLLIGALVALWLIVRDLNDGTDVPEENGTSVSITR